MGLCVVSAERSPFCTSLSTIGPKSDWCLLRPAGHFDSNREVRGSSEVSLSKAQTKSDGRQADASNVAAQETDWDHLAAVYRCRIKTCFSCCHWSGLHKWFVILYNKVCLLYIRSCFVFFVTLNAPIRLINHDSVWLITAEFVMESCCPTDYPQDCPSLEVSTSAAAQLFSQTNCYRDNLKPPRSLWAAAVFD